MNKKTITIEDLALMVQKGFEETATKADLEKFAKKTDLEKFATKIEMNKRFDQIEKRFDQLEKIILADHKKRIENLEVEVKELRSLFLSNISCK